MTNKDNLDSPNIHQENEQLRDRLDDLECQFAFQHETIETLNTEVSKQWEAIDRITKRLQRMTEQVVSMESDAGKPQDEPPPPHY